jgi:hypothetical protein
MNANELIELLDKNSGDGDTPLRQAVTLLRQQQARIEALEVNVKFWVAMAEKERVRADRNEQ